MALVGDIQLQDSAVKPATLDTSLKFSAEGLTATTAFAVTDAGAGTTVTPLGLFTAQSGNNISAYFNTTKTDGDVNLYLNNDENPYWNVKLSATAGTTDSFMIANSCGTITAEGDTKGDPCEYPAFSITPLGAVGIGKTGASNILDITYANSTTGGLVLTESTNSVATKVISLATCSVMGTSTNHPLGFITNDTTRAIFDISGQFGIGTCAPGAMLDVRGSAIFNEAGADADFRIEGDTEANLFFVDASTDRIGIGTATPCVELDVDFGGDGTGVLMCVNGCICAAGYMGEKQGHTIETSAVALTQRTGLNFVVTDVGCVVDDCSNNATVVCISGANTCVPFLNCAGASDPISLTGGSIGNAVANDSAPCLGGTLNGCDNVVCCVLCMCISGCYFGDGSQLTGVSSVPSSFSGDCTIIGCSAGGNVAAGASNVTIIGGNAGYNATIPTDIVFIGTYAGMCATTACQQVLIGTLAGRHVETCAGNVAIGAYSLHTECAGIYNTVVGTCTALTQCGADNNTFIGAYAGTAVTTGSANVFVGYKAGCAETTGACCLIIGNGTCDIITGNFNTSLISMVPSGGCVGIGTTAPSRTLHIASDGEANFAIETNNAGASNFAGIRLYRSRGTAASPTIVADDDNLSNIYSYGYDGSAYGTAASIRVDVDGTPGSADMPGRLVFSTTADGACTVTEAMRIDSSQYVGIGTTTPCSILDIQISSRATAFDPECGDTWHDIILTNPNGTAGSAVGMFFQTTGYHQNAGVGIAAVAGDGDFDADLVFITRPNASGSQERMRIDEDGCVGIGTASPASLLHAQGTVQVGVDDTGYDVKFFGASAGAFMLYDESANTLDVRGATAAGPGVLKLTTGELTNVCGGILGRLEFQAPLDSAGTDACLVAASIWAEADATFAAACNQTDLVFATADSETAAEKMRITSCGYVGIGTTAPDGELHVVGGSAGSVTAYAYANELVVENDDDAGISILGVNACYQQIAFGSPGDNTGAMIRWNYDASLLTIGTGGSGHSIRFMTDDMVEAMRIDCAGCVGIGTATVATNLVVAGSNASDPLTIRLKRTNSTTASGVIDFVGSADAVGASIAYNQVVGAGIEFNDNGDTNRMFIMDAGNVGIGTTAPDSLLHVENGDSGQSAHANADEFHIESSSSEVGMTISGPANNSGNIFFADAAAVNPGSIIYDHSTDDMTFWSTDDIVFAPDNSEAARFQAGNLGIGNTAPGALLEISKSAANATQELSTWSTTDTHESTLTFQKSSSATINTCAATADDERLGVIYFNGVATYAGGSIATAAQIKVEQDGSATAGATPGRMMFYTSDSSLVPERMRIDSSGNVGIGTTSANIGSFGTCITVLTIAGTCTGSPETANYGVLELISPEACNTSRMGDIVFAGTDAAGTGICAQARIRGHMDSALDASAISFFVEPTGGSIGEVMRIASDGFVGIGTTSPQQLLHIADSGPANVSIRMGDDTTWYGNIHYLESSGGLTLAAAGSSPSAHIIFATQGTEQVRVTGDGYLLVGKTAVDITAGGAQIDSNGRPDFTVSGATVMAINRTSDTGQLISFRYANTEYGSVSTDGSNVAFNTSSDYRLKENIVDLTGAVTRLKNLQPRRFNFKEIPDVTKDGFIAHEASAIVPEAVTGTKDGTETLSNVIVDADGIVLAENQTETAWISGKESKLVSEAIEAVDAVLYVDGDEITEGKSIGDVKTPAIEAVDAVYGSAPYASDTVWHETLTVPKYQGIDQAKLVPLLTAAMQELVTRVETLEAA